KVDIVAGLNNERLSVHEKLDRAPLKQRLVQRIGEVAQQALAARKTRECVILEHGQARQIRLREQEFEDPSTGILAGDNRDQSCVFPALPRPVGLRRPTPASSPLAPLAGPPYRGSCLNSVVPDNP